MKQKCAEGSHCGGQGKYFSGRIQTTLNYACGISVLFIGIAGAMEGMLNIGPEVWEADGPCWWS